MLVERLGAEGTPPRGALLGPARLGTPGESMAGHSHSAPLKTWQLGDP